MTGVIRPMCLCSIPPALSVFPDDEYTEPDLPWHMGAGELFVRARLRVERQIDDVIAALDMRSFLELELASIELVGAARGLSLQHAALQHVPHCTLPALRAARYEVKLTCQVVTTLLASCVEFARVNPRLRDILSEHIVLIRTALNQDLHYFTERAAVGG